MNKLKDTLHLLQQARAFPIFVMLFMMWLVYDFHEFYKANFHDLKEWQMVAVGGYIAGFVTAIKFMFDHITKKVERDDD